MKPKNYQNKVKEEIDRLEKRFKLLNYYKIAKMWKIKSFLEIYQRDGLTFLLRQTDQNQNKQNFHNLLKFEDHKSFSDFSNFKMMFPEQWMTSELSMILGFDPQDIIRYVIPIVP